MARKRRGSRTGDINPRKHQRIDLHANVDANSSYVRPLPETFGDFDSQPRMEECIIVCTAAPEAHEPHPADLRPRAITRHQDDLQNQSGTQHRSGPQHPADLQPRAITRHQDDLQNQSNTQHRSGPQHQSDMQDQCNIMASDLAASLASRDSTELIHLQNARDLALANQSAEQMIRANRASSTRKAYDQKIKQWKQWCLDRQFEDYDTVTESKLFLYLSSQVIPNGVQTKGKRHGTALSEQGLDGYIKPIITLYKVNLL